MKKLLISAFIFFIGLSGASEARASSILFQPQVISARSGSTFTLPIVIDPSNTKQYTVRVALTFPISLLEVTAFTFGPTWLAVPQPGYDSTDNLRGELIKTGGIPGGFSSPITFGTVTFRAKAQGSGAITVGTQSFILNANNTNTLDSRPQAQVVATAAAVPNAAPIAPLPSLPATGPSVSPTGVVSSTVPVAEPVPAFPSTGTTTSEVVIAPVEGSGRNNVLFFILILIAAIVIGIVSRVIYVRNKRRSFASQIKQDEDLRN